MRKLDHQILIGLRGVVRDENRTARYWSHKFDLPMILLAIWIIIEWYASAEGHLPPPLSAVTAWLVWCFFLFETLLLTSLVDNKSRYLLTNWLNLVIIVIGLPVLWDGKTEIAALRTLRLFLVLPMLLGISRTLRRFLSRNQLGITLLVALFIIVAAGILIAGIDPAIDNIWDGFWWAWVTVTTVGYGDIVPASTPGRIFGGVLILFGLGLFSLITANISAFLLSKDEAELLREERMEIAQLESITQRLEHLEASLERIEQLLSQERGSR
ncbi:MAG: potassium channel family protein [Gammaproteobacteria bacterium]|jgi:voltage-gated potassium channel